MSESTSHRDEFIANLRAMADLLEQNENLPVPYSAYLGVYPESLDDARVARKGIFGWNKSADKGAAFTEYSLSVGGDKYGQGSVTYSMSVAKANSCQRVQIGTKHIEAHDVPVYVWDCDTDTTESDVHEAKVIENHTNTIG